MGEGLERHCIFFGSESAEVLQGRGGGKIINNRRNRLFRKNDSRKILQKNLLNVSVSVSLDRGP